MHITIVLWALNSDTVHRCVYFFLSFVVYGRERKKLFLVDLFEHCCCCCCYRGSGNTHYNRRVIGKRNWIQIQIQTKLISNRRRVSYELKTLEEKKSPGKWMKNEDARVVESGVQSPRHSDEYSFRATVNLIGKQSNWIFLSICIHCTRRSVGWSSEQ